MWLAGFKKSPKEEVSRFLIGSLEIVSVMAETAGKAAPDGPYFHKDRIKYSPEEEARLERQHFWRIIDAFRFYRYQCFT